MNQRIITAAVTLVLAVVILPQRNETAPPPQPADNLRGHVVDRQGKGLLNATLELYPNCDEPKDACEKALKSTTSNNEGAYSIDEKGLTPGVYRLMSQLLPYRRMPSYHILRQRCFPKASRRLLRGFSIGPRRLKLFLHSERLLSFRVHLKESIRTQM